MKAQILILILACIFPNVSNMSLQHEGNYDTCFYLPLGNISTDRHFNYTITSAWTAEQSAQLKSGALNTSDFIHVSGWHPYKHPNHFFATVGRKGRAITHDLAFVKNVLEGSDAP
jgi:hypothetical protein